MDTMANSLLQPSASAPGDHQPEVKIAMQSATIKAVKSFREGLVTFIYAKGDVTVQLR
jgi:hypothetical protein